MAFLHGLNMKHLLVAVNDQLMILHGAWSGREAETPDLVAVFELCHCCSIIVDAGEAVRALPTVLHWPRGGLGGQSEQGSQSKGGVWNRGLSRKEEGQGTRWQHYFVWNTELGLSWNTWPSLDIRNIVPLLLSHSTETWYFAQRRSRLGLFLYPPPPPTLPFLLLPATSHWILWIID